MGREAYVARRRVVIRTRNGAARPSGGCAGTPAARELISGVGPCGAADIRHYWVEGWPFVLRDVPIGLRDTTLSRVALSGRLQTVMSKRIQIVVTASAHLGDGPEGK
jgi:hypothetical protein